jgi:hypothetical protein
MRRYIERSSDAGPSSLRLFCLGCIIATRGYDFREGQDDRRVISCMIQRSQSEPKMMLQRFPR